MKAPVSPIRFALAGIMAALISTAAMAQLSPGPLSKAHEQLDTPLKCLECHGGEQSMDDRCLDCHKTISFLALKGRGLHGKSADQNCSGCHIEHAGREFSLIRFEEGSPERFNHGRAGWRLVGRHAERKCEDCHKAEFRNLELLKMSADKDLEDSYLGLETACASCHKDIHRGALGPQCGACHTPASWNEVPEFDHGRTGYPLTGKHMALRCEQCHKTGRPAGGATAPLRHEQCSSCHEDTHQGRLGQACSACHVTTGFRDRGGKPFDHARTGFTLAGKHRDVRCEKCHEKEQRPAHDRCLDCHTDQHGGQLAARLDGGECATCHQVVGWTPSTFTVEDHDRSTFPLQGRHKVVRCARCHRPGPNGRAGAELGPARVALHPGGKDCTGCHIDPHEGGLTVASTAADKRTCTACHGQDRFRPSTLTVRSHGDFGFPLEGAHASATCGQCHEAIGRRPPESFPDPAATTAGLPASLPDRSSDGALSFRADPRCVTCHFNPHGGQFLSRKDGGACDGCHAGASFRPALKFDHNRATRFPLLRAHGSVACGTCHQPGRGDSGPATVTYRAVTLDCRECHKRTAVAVSGRAGRFPNRSGQ